MDERKKPHLERLGPAAAHARSKADLSQGQTEKLSGVPGDTISRIERGIHKDPSLSTLWAIADAYAVSLDDLVGRTVPVKRATR